jgi:hypothetical protein
MTIVARIDAAVLGDRHARLIDALTARIDPQGAVRERCASRVAESAMFLRLLQGEHAEPEVQDGLITYLRGAEPADEGSQIIRDAALGHPDLRRAGVFRERFEHGTGERKQLMLRTAFALFDLLPFEDLPPIRYRGQAVWTEVSLCAIKILHGHAHGRRDEADQAFLTSHLASAGPGRVWQGNVLAHLIALHALRTFEPGGLLTMNGTEAVAITRHSDGGVPFVTSQDVSLTRPWRGSAWRLVTARRSSSPRWPTGSPPSSFPTADGPTAPIAPRPIRTTRPGAYSFSTW